MKFINLTPHTVRIRDFSDEIIELPSSGHAHVDTTEDDLGFIGGFEIISAPRYGEVIGLPAPSEGVAYIVSGVVAGHADVKARADVFRPATGPNHGVIRDGDKRIQAVTKLIAMEDAPWAKR